MFLSIADGSSLAMETTFCWTKLDVRHASVTVREHVPMLYRASTVYAVHVFTLLSRKTFFFRAAWWAHIRKPRKRRALERLGRRRSPAHEQALKYTVHPLQSSTWLMFKVEKYFRWLRHSLSRGITCTYRTWYNVFFPPFVNTGTILCVSFRPAVSDCGDG